MTRRVAAVAIVLALASLLGAIVLRGMGPIGPQVLGVAVSLLLVRALFAASVLLATYACYRLSLRAFTRRETSKRRIHTTRNVLRLVFFILGLIAALGAATEQWVGLLFSFGVVGFAITFALQQPLLSLLGWVYIVIKEPYNVGDRVKIDDAKGDVIDVDFLVTTLWEVNGELVSTHQPSGRIITVPNSVVLSREVYNYSWTQFPYIWNELPVQVAYETDLAFASETMRQVADDYLGDEMEQNVDKYRSILARTPVELDVVGRPTVNIRLAESWVELRVRYLIEPTGGTQVRNELYELILAALNDHPDRVKFPVGRNR
ncbi:MAG: mechanosensitive ion channel family protein [Halobacteriales archaeon]|nr:mechanosensitive ion channel family protein [Halobacteriales archaeon]